MRALVRWQPCLFQIPFPFDEDGISNGNPEMSYVMQRCPENDSRMMGVFPLLNHTSKLRVLVGAAEM